jgi:hypothetical protein
MRHRRRRKVDRRQYRLPNVLARKNHAKFVATSSLRASNLYSCDDLGVIQKRALHGLGSAPEAVSSAQFLEHYESWHSERTPKYFVSRSFRESAREGGRLGEATLPAPLYGYHAQHESAQ